MEVKDETLSLTDIDSDSDDKQGLFISLTDINSDSDENFTLVDCENIPLEQSCTDRNKDSSLPLFSSRFNSNTQSSSERNRPEFSRTENKKNSVLNKNPKNTIMASNGTSKRRDFISDSSSDEDLPVMDSLRARLARKRQTAMASPFLPAETSEKLSDVLVHKSHGATVLETLEKHSTDYVSFSDSSGDEGEKVPLSSFLSSPNNRHPDIPKSPELDNGHSLLIVNKDNSNGNLGERVPGSLLSGHVFIENDDVSVGQFSESSNDSKATIYSRSACQPSEPKIRKKRTAAEVEENKKKAQTGWLQLQN